MKKATAILVILLSVSISTKGQITFQKTFGGNDFDNGYSVQQTTDGGYILFGETQSFGSGSQDMYLIKTDELGNEQWSQTYGGPNWEFGRAALETNDGGYLLCGTYSALGNDTLTMIKTDALGNEIWNKKYSASQVGDAGHFVQQTSDGGYIAVGYANTGSDSHVYLVKTDPAGNEIWNKVLFAPGTQNAREVRQTDDGGYAIIGQTDGQGAGGLDFYLIRTDDQGDTLWTKTYGTALGEIGTALYLTDDGGMILAGRGDFSGGDILVIKTDDLGNEEWSEYYGDSGWDEANSIRQTTDGGYVFCGRKENINNGDSEMCIVKIDATGGIEWENTFPLGLVSVAFSIDQTSDGGYVMLGYTIETIPTVDVDFFMVKTDGLGVVAVVEYAIPTVQVRAYPNPFTELVTIELINAERQDLTFVLFDETGRVVREIQQLPSDRVTIQRKNLSSGTYLFQFRNSEQLIATGKLIVE